MAETQARVHLAPPKRATGILRLSVLEIKLEFGECQLSSNLNPLSVTTEGRLKYRNCLLTNRRVALKIVQHRLLNRSESHRVRRPALHKLCGRLEV